MSINGLGFPPSTGVVPHLFKPRPRSKEEWEDKIEESLMSLMLDRDLLIKFWSPHSEKSSQAYGLCEIALTDFYRQCCKTSWIMRRYIEKVPFRGEFLASPTETLNGILDDCRLLMGRLIPPEPQPILLPTELADAQEMLSKLIALAEKSLQPRASAFKSLTRVAEDVLERPTKRSRPAASYDEREELSEIIDNQDGEVDDKYPSWRPPTPMPGKKARSVSMKTVSKLPDNDAENEALESLISLRNIGEVGEAQVMVALPNFGI